MTADGETRVCSGCGGTFVLSPPQESWLRDRVTRAGGEYHAPGRCYSCQTQAAIAARPYLRQATCCSCGEACAVPAAVPNEVARCRACLGGRRR